MSIFMAQELNVEISMFKILIIIYAMILGMLLYISFVIFVCGTVLIFIKIGRTWEVIDAILKFADYPLNLYPHVIQVIFWAIIPIGLISYFPTLSLLDKPTVKIVFSILPIVLILYISIKFWGYCMKRYSSLGG